LFSYFSLSPNQQQQQQLAPTAFAEIIKSRNLHYILISHIITITNEQQQQPHTTQSKDVEHDLQVG